ncbi:MAG TPA: DUF962 domain-containing protein [Candidatus Thermoplasmatota archaeon]|nr:DUF962 domain-containing protein [Candidatus Thermoplasmatota archaeon]
MAEAKYRTLQEFWPFYLSQHRRPLTQALHVAGSAAAIVFLGLAVAFRSWWFVLAALVAGYGLAWIGHFFVEHNRPATFTYPVKSFLSDWRLLWVVVTGRLERELELHLR